MEKTTAGIIKTLIDYAKENYGSPSVRIMLAEPGSDDTHTLMQWPSASAVGDIHDVPNIIGIASMYRGWIRPVHDIFVETGYLVDNEFHKVGSIIVITE